MAGPTRGGRVSGVEFRTYTDPASPVGRSYVVEADLVVLAAHAVENARLLLFSGLANGSDQVGRNLMDHPTILNWALADEERGPVGPFRGPGTPPAGRPSASAKGAPGGPRSGSRSATGAGAGPPARR
ncbi:GMC family oxidoreductase N-terminal domain-containing protein [Kitasatospora aburaviensis]